ncbi:MAG: adenosylcobinamide-phosphate synthase CbiB [Caulobacteraceae bacterium]
MTRAPARLSGARRPRLSAAGALTLEAAVGYPAAWPHPVAALGGLIDVLERRWNRPQLGDRTRQALGTLTLGLVAGGAALAGLAVERACERTPLGRLARAALASPGLAQRSLYEHVAQVQSAEGLSAARVAVGRIVGRDTAELDRAGVTAAAIESLAESFNDGVVAPAFWLLVGGLPGLWAYKAVNTADSMIGHMEPRWRAFGWAAARTDDLMNLIPARLAGGLIALAAGRGGRIMVRDARRHASPNAGWPEAAMAGALGVTLGGPAWYDGVLVQRPSFGDGSAPCPEDLTRGLDVYVRACALLLASVVLVEAACRRR